MNTYNPSIPISDKKFASIERMRTNVLEKAQERGLKIEEKINNHFDELLKIHNLYKICVGLCCPGFPLQPTQVFKSRFGTSPETRIWNYLSPFEI